MKSLSVFIGRILIAALFLYSGMGKIGEGFASTRQYMAANGMSATALWLTLGIIAEVAGAAMVVLGVYARIGAALLLLFLIPVTFIFHTDFAQQDQ